MCGGYVGDKLKLRPKLPSVQQSSPESDAIAADAAAAQAQGQIRSQRRRSSLLLSGGVNDTSGSGSSPQAKALLGQ